MFLYITELSDLGFDPHGNPVMCAVVPGIAEQRVAIGAASAVSAPFDPATRYVMVHCDYPCCLAWGAAPVAVTTAHRLGAGETRFYAPNPSGISVAVIAST